ncbi:MAG: hypothetical protein LIO91_13610 [Bacteroidales bacterium]|nr:hypothetical protein [Bacteroidales bacterium]
MAYTPCDSSQIGMNAQKNCLFPAYAGLQTLAIMCRWEDVNRIIYYHEHGGDESSSNYSGGGEQETVTMQNKNRIKRILLKGWVNEKEDEDENNNQGDQLPSEPTHDSEKEEEEEEEDDDTSYAKWIAIEAGGATPYADTSEEYDADSGTFTKTLTFTAPRAGAEFSSEFIEPLLRNKNGWVVVLQRKDKKGGDSAFPILGLDNGLIASEASLNYTDGESGGCYSFTLTETYAPNAEMDLWWGNYHDTQNEFNSYLKYTIDDHGSAEED